MQSSELHNWATAIRGETVDGGARSQWSCSPHGTVYLCGEGFKALHDQDMVQVKEVDRPGPVSRENDSLNPGLVLLAAS